MYTVSQWSDVWANPYDLLRRCAPINPDAMTPDPNSFDPSEISVSSFSEAEDADRAYWHAQTPHERLAALEQMRQINYAYDPVSDRIQRTLEVAERA